MTWGTGRRLPIILILVLALLYKSLSHRPTLGLAVPVTSASDAQAGSEAVRELPTTDDDST